MTVNVSAHVARNARKFPGRVSLIDGWGHLTYADLDRQVNRVANHLLSEGVRAGDRVGLMSKSSLNWVVAFLAVVRVRAVAVTLNYRQLPEIVQGNLTEVDCRLVFTTADFAGSHFPTSSGIRTLLMDRATGLDTLDQLVAGQSDAAPEISPVADETQLIIFTGGTTGKSKGVMLTAENIFWNSLHEIIDTGMNEFDNTVLTTPLHFAAALNCWLLPHLYIGATATILTDYSPENVLDAIATHGGTNAFMPPNMAREVCAAARAGRPERLRSLKRWYVGGGVLPEADRKEMHDLVPGSRIFYQYGLTEAGVIVTVLKEEDYDLAPNSIGRPFVNFEVKIVREDLSDAAPGEHGEICVRGPSVMKGYYGRPDATAEVFLDEWLRTGDVGAIDESGFIYFHDRLKDMVKTGGINVYCQEVERLIAAHEDVQEIGIVGVPSERWGEELVAVVILRPGATLNEEGLIGFAKTQMPHYMTPKQVLFAAVGDIPISESGKIIKRQLRDFVMNRLSSEAVA